MRAVDGFLQRLADHVAGITDPADAVTEAVATALEWLPKEKYIGLLMAPGGTSHVESVTSDVGLQFARDMVGRLDVDWAAAGYPAEHVDETRRASAAGDPVVRHRPGPSTAPRRGIARLLATVGGRRAGRYTTVSGSERLGWNSKEAPPLNFTTDTSPSSRAGVSRRTTCAVHSVEVPVSSTSR